MTGIPFSVVIPAHDEEAVIERCLRHLTAGLKNVECQILVVCNDCHDHTAERARAFPGVQVLETALRGKTHALNLGDAAARYAPRIYLDADILLPGSAARRLAALLAHGPLLAASPRFEPELAGRGWTVRRYYHLWCQLPYLCEGAIGHGVYALSAAGRARFAEFPPLIADDAFVRGHFVPTERGLCAEAVARFFPPKRLADLLRIAVRIRYGNLELRRFNADTAEGASGHNWQSLRPLLARRANWGALLLYLAVTLAAEAGARLWYHLGWRGRWLRDTSGRVG